MFTYTYTLTDLEYAKYTNLFVFQDKSVRTKGLIFRYGLPILFVICMFLLHIQQWYLYALVAVLSCVWIGLAKHLFPSMITKIVKESCPPSTFDELRLSIAKNQIEVSRNGKTEQFFLQKYVFCKDFMILFNQEQQSLLVPVRIIQQDMRNIIPLLEQMQNS